MNSKELYNNICVAGYYCQMGWHYGMRFRLSAVKLCLVPSDMQRAVSRTGQPRIESLEVSLGVALEAGKSFHSYLTPYKLSETGSSKSLPLHVTCLAAAAGGAVCNTSPECRTPNNRKLPVYFQHIFNRFQMFSCAIYKSQITQVGIGY